MKIAVDTGPLKSGDSVRGIGVYTREIIEALESIQKIGSNKFDLYPIDYFNHQSSSVDHYDVIHFTRFNPFFVSIPLRKQKHVKFVLTIYDLIPLIYPEHYPSGVKGWMNWQINKFIIKKNVDAIITISETSKKDICRFIGVNPDKVHVTHLAPRFAFRKLQIGTWKPEIRKRYGLPDRFALYVGDINYNKNIPVLIESCKIAEIPLAVVGKQAKEIKNMDLNHPELAHLKGLNWDEVIRPGFVPDEDLVKIYNLASIYVQPSLCEGFGLPVLEAQAAGVAVVASKTQALTEITGDSAIFAEPNSVHDLAGQIILLMGDLSLKKELVKKGFKNAEKYSWNKTAAKTLQIYQTEQ